MKKYLLCAILALGVCCTTSEDPVPDIIAAHVEFIEEQETGRKFITVDPVKLSGWMLAKGQGGDSLFLQYSDKVHEAIYSPDYLHVPDTLALITNDLRAFKARARWDMTEHGVDTTWIKEYVVDWSDSTYSWYSLLVTDGYAYPEEFIEDLKLEIL